MFYLNTRNVITSLSLVLLAGGISLHTVETLLAGEPQETAIHKTGMTHQDSPGWAEQLKGQTIVEDAMEGRAERAALVEQQHQRMMQQMQKDMDHQGAETGAFNSMSMIHQYGGGPANGLLASNLGSSPFHARGIVSQDGPRQQVRYFSHDVEITLNQWLDYYPGYMYALTENIDKIREEEAKNAEAREMEGIRIRGCEKWYSRPVDPTISDSRQSRRLRQGYSAQPIAIRRRGQFAHQWFGYGHEPDRPASPYHQSRFRGGGRPIH